MIRSLRWRLQIWHALLLTTVLVIFGGVVYALQWQTRVQQTVAELDGVASVLRSRMRGLFPIPRMPGPGMRPAPRNSGRGLNAGRPNDSVELMADALAPENGPDAHRTDFVRDEEKEDSLDARRRNTWLGIRGLREGVRDGNRDAGAPSPKEGISDGPTREGASANVEDRPRDPSGRIQRFDPPPGLELPEEFQHLFDPEEKNSLYFVIWDQHETVLEHSKSVEEIPFPELRTKSDGLPVRGDRVRGTNREVIHASRFGRGSSAAEIKILVGRSLQPDLDWLHQSGILLTLTGLGVLVIGLAGGWWFSTSAIRPIAEMSTTAESISVKNLSNRINVKSTATELEQLASVLNRTFDRLQSAFERQGQFTADASHELRTPLSVILSHAELALARPRSGEEYQQAFQACRRASLRMKSLIDSLLLLARYDSKEPETARHRVDLGRLAQEAVDMLQPLAEERRVLLQCCTDDVAIVADQEQFFQVLTNLLNNAIRYNRNDGRVQLQVTCENQFAVVRVTDTGVGIAPEDLPRIFDRFFRVDKARSRTEGGSGLGLAICQAIIESHGGTILATSELGVGTTIEVKIPLAREVSTITNAKSASVVAGTLGR